jgi:SAM-dependent methyltransferase
MLVDPVRRFSSRVQAYVRYRPNYPPQVLHFLETECGLSPYSQVADLGSGTGILSRLFLDYGCEVTGVEPNAEMRAAGEQQLAGYHRFSSVEGSAEATGLPEHSFDLAAAGQSFHWFDPVAARREFRRILRPPRWVALIWNQRLATDPFLAGYAELLERHAPDYKAADQRPVDAPALNAFFEHRNWRKAVFDNSQTFDLEGLRGRLASSSYAPQPGTPEHRALQLGIAELFQKHQRDGRIVFRYQTNVYTGTL